MEKKLIGLVGMLLTLIGTGLGLSSAHPVLAAESEPQQIILISVGGLNYEAYVSLNLPVLKALLGQGTGCAQALTVPAESQVAAESSMLCSVWPEEHQHIKPQDRVAVASLFDLLHKYGRSFLILDGTGGDLEAYSYGDTTYQSFARDIDASLLLPAALDLIRERQPRLSYICIDDGSDDLQQLDQEAYYAALNDFDQALGGLINHLQRENKMDSTMLIVCSPGSSSASHYSPLLIYYPPWHGLSPLQGVSVLDILPTIGAAWGLEMPATIRGIPIYGAMEKAGQSISPQYENWLNALQQERIAAYKRNNQLTEALRQSRQEIASREDFHQNATEFLQERDDLILAMKQGHKMERLIMALLLVVLLGFFFLQYRWLKRKYLLFK